MLEAGVKVGQTFLSATFIPSHVAQKCDAGTIEHVDIRVNRPPFVADCEEPPWRRSGAIGFHFVRMCQGVVKLTFRDFTLHCVVRNAGIPVWNSPIISSICDSTPPLWLLATVTNVNYIFRSTTIRIPDQW